MEGQAMASNQYIIFRMNNEEYGIDIQKVTTIEKLLAITRVPHAPEGVRGVINLRGEIIPVVELAQKLHLGQFVHSDDTRIIIFKIEDLSVGFIVDEVVEVLTIPEENIENITQVSNDVAIDYICGIGKIKGKIVTLLNLDKLVVLK
ncbi:MAG: chemotaxis protein CheW [Ignavibacteriales bacterium]